MIHEERKRERRGESRGRPRSSFPLCRARRVLFVKFVQESLAGETERET